MTIHWKSAILRDLFPQLNKSKGKQISGRKNRNHSAYGSAPASLYILTSFKLYLSFSKYMRSWCSELYKLELEIPFLGKHQTLSAKHCCNSRSSCFNYEKVPGLLLTKILSLPLYWKFTKSSGKGLKYHALASKRCFITASSNLTLQMGVFKN